MKPSPNSDCVLMFVMLVMIATISTRYKNGGFHFITWINDRPSTSWKWNLSLSFLLYTYNENFFEQWSKMNSSLFTVKAISSGNPTDFWLSVSLTKSNILLVNWSAMEYLTKENEKWIRTIDLRFLQRIDWKSTLFFALLKIYIFHSAQHCHSFHEHHLPLLLLTLSNTHSQYNFFAFLRNVFSLLPNCKGNFSKLSKRLKYFASKNSVFSPIKTMFTQWESARNRYWFETFVNATPQMHYQSIDHESSWNLLYEKYFLSWLTHVVSISK